MVSCGVCCRHNTFLEGLVCRFATRGLPRLDWTQDTLQHTSPPLPHQDKSPWDLVFPSLTPLTDVWSVEFVDAARQRHPANCDLCLRDDGGTRCRVGPNEGMVEMECAGDRAESSNKFHNLEE
ncbi:hypothetical protein O3P69_019606 [Scylla paramamosain]|uniref:Uncharacterized protein n=1 Tax=Scylla paramamosain TaxID=85552 RepID=A0AAW0SWQ0_SCYPA